MYDQYYGLNSRPFQLTPDPQYYFESGTHRKALSYLGYGLAQGEGFIVITGEVGAGKSTLVGHLMQSIDKGRLTAAQIVTSQLDALDLVQITAASYGIDTRGLDKGAILKSIENFLHAEARAGRRCLLIVDEAQNLSIDALEELRMLSNFQLGSSPLLQIFLLGQPEFRDLVQNSDDLEQLRQRIIAIHHLEPMEGDEVAPYIIHRLTRAGWNGRPQFSEGAFDAIYANTLGIPRKVNTLMNRVLLMGAVEQVEAIDDTLITAVIADMAGKPFEYEAPLSSRGTVSLPVPDIAPAVDRVAVLEPAAQDGADTQDSDIADEDNAGDDESESGGEMASLAAAIVSPIKRHDNSQYHDVVERLSLLEKRVGEQDAALRRVLTMMIDWMDKEQALDARYKQNERAA